MKLTLGQVPVIRRSGPQGRRKALCQEGFHLIQDSDKTLEKRPVLLLLVLVFPRFSAAIDANALPA